MKAALDNPHTNEYGCVPKQLYLENHVVGQTCSVAHSLLTPNLEQISQPGSSFELPNTENYLNGYAFRSPKGARDLEQWFSVRCSVLLH